VARWFSHRAGVRRLSSDRADIGVMARTLAADRVHFARGVTPVEFLSNVLIATGDVSRAKLDSILRAYVHLDRDGNQLLDLSEAHADPSGPPSGPRPPANSNMALPGPPFAMNRLSEGGGPMDAPQGGKPFHVQGGGTYTYNTPTKAQEGGQFAPQPNGNQFGHW
jgi:hypothetical protein